MMKHQFKILLVFLCCTLSVMAQDEQKPIRSVTSSYTFEYGTSHLADTYLTPLHYRGYHTTFQYERVQPMRFNPQNWIMQLKLTTVFDNTKNPAKNANMINASVQGAWNMMHRWKLGHGLMIGVGGGTSFDGGLLYQSRNGNNPASAKVGWTLDATGFLGWRYKVWRIPFTLRYQATMPVTGAFFSPDYGELYYQIYVGDHEKLLHPAWPGNYFKLDNLFTADLHFGNTSLRIGYHNSIFSSKVNNIVSQAIEHAIVFGITTEWISLRPNDKKIDAQIISAY